MSNESIANEAVQKIKKFEDEFMMEFMKRVAERTPVRSGLAQRSYTIEQQGNGWVLKNEQEYVVYLELGTLHDSPHAMIQTTMVEYQDIMDIAKARAGL